MIAIALRGGTNIHIAKYFSWKYKVNKIQNPYNSCIEPVPFISDLEQCGGLATH